MHSLASVLLLLMMASPLPVPYKITNKLSKECWNMFKYDLQNTCPDPEKAYDLDLQEVCCNSSHTLKLHCQVDDDMQLFPACLPEETCKPGFSCRIVQGSDGLPKLTQEPCWKGFFASENRSSVSQIYPFCRDSHTVCRNTGQTVFCEGDSTSDTRCICKDGYSTRGIGCDKAFTQHSVCSCIPSDTNYTYCPAWKHSEIPLCSQLSPEQLLIKTTDCPKPTIKPRSDVTESITAFGTTIEDSAAFGTTEQPVTTAPPQAENKSAAMPPWQITVIIVVVLLMAAAGIIFWPNIKAVMGRVRDYNLVSH